MKISEAIKKCRPLSETVRNLDDARLACRKAGCLDEETSLLLKLKAELEQFTKQMVTLGS